MKTDSIGIQVIMPTTGTSPQQSPAQEASARQQAPEPSRPAPPPPGMGKFVDKTV
jgi:hypothetical protein